MDYEVMGQHYRVFRRRQKARYFHHDRHGSIHRIHGHGCRTRPEKLNHPWSNVFFIVNEGISILENCAQIGLPIPAVLFNALEKMHRDPSGKEQRLIRHPILDRIDKKELLKENEALHHQLKKQKGINQMKINWRVRMKNKLFWLAMVPAFYWSCKL